MRIGDIRSKNSEVVSKSGEAISSVKKKDKTVRHRAISVSQRNISPFLWPPHYKSMGKKSTLLYLLWHKLIWVESYRLGQLWTILVKICIAYPSKGHLRSPNVTNSHLPITFDQKEAETWDWCHYVRLGQANRLICNMTHFGHHVTLAWLDLRSNLYLDFSRSFYIWFDAPLRCKHDGIKIAAVP